MLKQKKKMWQRSFKDFLLFVLISLILHIEKANGFTKELTDFLADITWKNFVNFYGSILY